MKISWKEQAAKNLCIHCGENPLDSGDCRGNDYRWQDYLEMIEVVEQARILHGNVLLSDSEFQNLIGNTKGETE